MKNRQTEEGEEVNLKFRISIKNDQNSQTVNLEQV